jgi:hypothetical protein
MKDWFVPSPPFWSLCWSLIRLYKVIVRPLFLVAILQFSILLVPIDDLAA